MNDVIKPEEIQELIQTLSIQRIELEMQNKELREPHDRLVTMHQRYQDHF